MRSDNMALYRDLTLYNFVYILLDYPTLFYDLLGEIRYDYSSSVCTFMNEYYSRQNYNYNFGRNEASNNTLAVTWVTVKGLISFYSYLFLMYKLLLICRRV